MGAGVVVRDNSGACVVSCRHQLLGVVEPEQAEALALLRAVQLAQEEGFPKVIFASDCLSLVQRVRSSSVDRLPVGVLVADIKSLAKSFTSVSFIHVKHCLNEAARSASRELYVLMLFNK
jgi:hypothetical protein